VASAFENHWFLSNINGSGSTLIPPDIDVSTYYDDTPHNACQMSSPFYPCPILWHTATESHEKIYAYIGSLNIGQPIAPLCFRVWEPNGMMIEYGCTLDSLQYYYQPASPTTDVALVSAWYPDLITDPQGNQIHITYQRDMASWTSSVTGQTYSYPRDVVLSSITYDSPNCHDAQTMCTGSSWTPLMQIVFNSAHTLPQVTPPSGCNTRSNMRCDNPVSISGGAGAPLIQNTYALTSAQVQVRSSGTDPWKTLHQYKMSYEQSGPTTITDPASGLSRSLSTALAAPQTDLAIAQTQAHTLFNSVYDTKCVPCQTEADKTYQTLQSREKGKFRALAWGVRDVEWWQVLLNGQTTSVTLAATLWSKVQYIDEYGKLNTVTPTGGEVIIYSLAKTGANWLITNKVVDDTATNNLPVNQMKPNGQKTGGPPSDEPPPVKNDQPVNKPKP
jgi:hypothetical protein